MELNITLEEAYAKASPGLRKKMQHSIELVRKAEKIALMYDAENGFWTAFSGGKDSQAVYHITQLAGVKHKAHFTPTSVDPPQVVRFIRNNYQEVDIIPIKKSIYTAFKEHNLLPGIKVRWCCSEFKENKAGNKVVIVGVRHAESVKRSGRKEVEVSGHKFSGDIEEFKTWGDEKRRQKLAKKSKKKKVEQFDQFSEHKEQMVTCVNGKDQITLSPILDWEDSDVWEFLNDVVSVPHCELYDEGFARIGCICCPMGTKKIIETQIRRWPHVKEKWIQAIMDVRRRSLEQATTPPHISDENQRVRKLIGMWAGNFGEGLTDRQVAENIFDWWLSKKSYKQWYSEKFEQQRLDL
jgi:phosphoadenosine phosphosulfate reductase